LGCFLIRSKGSEIARESERYETYVSRQMRLLRLRPKIREMALKRSLEHALAY